MIRTLRVACLAITALFCATALTACGDSATPGAASEAPPMTERESSDFGVRLGLLEGHLMVGRELLRAGQQANALPHFGHPVRELYSDLLPVIATRQGQQFDRDLIRLETMVASGDLSGFDELFDQVIAKLNAARALVPAELRESDDYTLRLIADSTTVAAQEYRNALVGGRIDSLIEYHDARGFVYYVSALCASHQSDDPRLAQASAIVADLKTVVGTLDPPNPPRATDAEFEARAESLREVVYK
jgi:hypothetical protein